MPNQHYCGFVAIVGRPNVGKSTLLNHILGQKISITSRKPQTTRNRILGIQTDKTHQVVYVDTPGIHQHAKKTMNRYMNKMALQAMNDVDLVVLMLQGTELSSDDKFAMEKLEHCPAPVIIAINKIDQLDNKNELLPHIKMLDEQFKSQGVYPISAKTGDNVERLVDTMKSAMPVSAFMFPDDQITDRSDEFLLTEIIREKLFRLTGHELPYATMVQLEKFECENNIYHISALITVEKESHKKMMIGKGGSKLKIIGQNARLDMERMLSNKVFLQLWVKTKKGWSDDDAMIKSLIY